MMARFCNFYSLLKSQYLVKRKSCNVFQTAKIYFSEKNIWGFKGHFKPNFSPYADKFRCMELFGGTYNHAATEYLIFFQKEYGWFREH